MEEPTIYTVGHSTRPIAQFVDLLRSGSVELVIDVRTIPRSRRNPQYHEEVLGAELGACRIGYARMPDLGGLRGRSLTVPADLNGLWKNQSFHNYADYALSEQFQLALGQVLKVSTSKRCALMCAEAVWWRCHRRIIADYLIASGASVYHLMSDDRVDLAQLTPGAKVEGKQIIYPAKSVPLPAHPASSNFVDERRELCGRSNDDWP